MGKGSNKTTTQSTQTYTPDPQIKETGYQALAGAQQAAQAPFQMPAAPVAGFSPFQQLAFGQTLGAQGMSLPYFDEASQYMRGSASPISEQDVQQYYNPFAQNVTNQLQNIFGQQQRQATMGATQAAGGIGADRIAVAQGNLANQQGLAAGQIYSGLYDKALQAAQQNKQMQAGAGFGMGQLGPAAQSSFLQGTGALAQAGAQQQALQQQQQNALYQQRLAEIAYPFQVPQYLAGITGSLAPALGGTTAGTQTVEKPQPSPLNQILGIGGALLGGFMGGPAGAMAGGSLGSSLGGGSGKGSGDTSSFGSTYGAPSGGYGSYGGIQYPTFRRGGRTFASGGATYGELAEQRFANSPVGNPYADNTSSDEPTEDSSYTRGGDVTIPRSRSDMFTPSMRDVVVRHPLGDAPDEHYRDAERARYERYRYAAGGDVDEPPPLPGTRPLPVDATTTVPKIALQMGAGHSGLLGHPHLDFRGPPEDKPAGGSDALGKVASLAGKALSMGMAGARGGRFEQGGDVTTGNEPVLVGQEPPPSLPSPPTPPPPGPMRRIPPAGPSIVAPMSSIPGYDNPFSGVGMMGRGMYDMPQRAPMMPPPPEMSRVGLLGPTGMSQQAPLPSNWMGRAPINKSVLTGGLTGRTGPGGFGRAAGGAVSPFDAYQGFQEGGDIGESWEPPTEVPFWPKQQDPHLSFGDVTSRAGDFYGGKAAEVGKAFDPDPNSLLNIQKHVQSARDAFSSGPPSAEARTPPAESPFSEPQAGPPIRQVREDMPEPVLQGPASSFAPGEEIPMPRGNPRTPGGAKFAMVGELDKAGMPSVGISGISMAVRDESNFNPFSREPDQPRWGGEAHYAHGLFQEGGAEWNKYQAWLQKNHPDAPWQDPNLQTRFLAENLKENYPKVWAAMQNARTPGEAAAIFTQGYLKPAKQYEEARVRKYLGGGGDESATGRPNNPYIVGNKDMTMGSLRMPERDRPYPGAREQNWGTRLARSPWSALIAGGAKMAQTTGPVGSALGAGIEAGLGHLEGQRKSLETEEGINQRAEALYDTAKRHLDTYQRMTPYEKATSEWRQTKLETPTGAAGWKYKAWLAAHPGDEHGALEFAGGRRQVPDPQLRKWASDQALKEARENPGIDIDKRTEELFRHYKESSPSGTAKATPTQADLDYVKAHPETAAKFKEKFGIDPPTG